MKRCYGVDIKGVVVKNPCSYNIYGGQCDTFNIDNFKCISAYLWADGIDMMSSSNITSNSFIRYSDDSIAIYGHRFSHYGDSLNWNVSNSIMWSDIAHGILVGTHGSQDPNNRDILGNLKFCNSDILEVNCNSKSYWGAMAINVGDENICRDITFENINVEDFTKSELVNVKVFMNPDYNPLPGFLIQNILFKNISYMVEI